MPHYTFPPISRLRRYNRAQLQVPFEHASTPQDEQVQNILAASNNSVPVIRSAPLIQAKLKAGAPNDPLEAEADCIADTVPDGSTAGVQVKNRSSLSVLHQACDECEQEL